MGEPPYGGAVEGCSAGAVGWKERHHAHAEDARGRMTREEVCVGPAAVETGRHEHTTAITMEWGRF